ncbi:MAG TPA: hypothetical protein H9717_11530 [Candidatus Eisenbergiella merdipullorum]|uniref:Uncharacterized protein n=1 Tax=Candidatus Eisenbergiella merdipullorum TaxID=2838553 RepID=A0A9D2I8X7_9FIRM|nr:hypothetical protein [Candidatus Eisenbergiella merdipullorum]
MKHFKKILERLNNKVFACCAVLLFLFSMLPLWYLAFYARPSGDDYGYSALTHAAWLDTHSLIEVLKAAVTTVINNYNSWNGDWVTTFLFSLMPEVFAPYSFWIVPFIMTGAVIAATWVFMHEICVKIAKIPITDCIIYTSLLLLAGYQFIPSTAIGMYWYVGSVHYMLPHAVGLLGLAWLSDFMRTGRRSRVLLLTFSAFFVGGSSYFTSLLLFMVLVAVFVLGWRKGRKKVMYLLIPFLVGMICFIIQCKAPGNAARGGENFGFNASLAVYTVLESLRRGITTIISYLREKTFVFVILFVIALFGMGSMDKATEKGKFSFPFPLLFVIFMYGCFSSMFAPEVYSEIYDSIEISLGPATIRYFVFLLTSALSILYCEGWVMVRIKKKKIFSGEKYRFRILFPGLLAAALFLLADRDWMHVCVDREAVEYVVSGQAEDFREQIASQMKILLDDSIKDAYLVPTNPEQGPLMHMPVTTDEDAFTNWAVKEFYRKDKVVMQQ